MADSWNTDGAGATPIFDALLAESSLEWSPPVWDPDAPNDWFEPLTKPDPATLADPPG